MPVGVGDNKEPGGASARVGFVMDKIASRLILIFLCASLPALSQTARPCPRYPTGSAITAPPDIYSSAGVLTVNLIYQTSVDQYGNQLFCFLTPDGAQSPTLHVNPGDLLVMNVTNNVPDQADFSLASSMEKHAHMRPTRGAPYVPKPRSASAAGPCDTNQDGAYNAPDAQIVINQVLGESAPVDDLNGDDAVNVVDVETAVNAVVTGSCLAIAPGQTECQGNTMSPSSVNVHFHGTNTPSTCHQDEVIFTIINPGQSFQYALQIPFNEPPGLYWYHPHVHGISEPAVLGGASGAIEVEGLQNMNSAVAGLAQQFLVIRDNLVPGDDLPDDAPAKDISLNYVPVPYPDYPPAQIAIGPGEQQLWRVLNAAADTIMDLQLTYDGQAQPLQIVALDGVPTGSQDGTAQGTSITQTDVQIPPAGRAEFIVTGPPAGVHSALLSTVAADTGPAGDYDPARPIATIQTSAGARAKLARVPAVKGVPPPARFKRLTQTVPTAQRSLYFSELSLDPGDPDASVIFFITVNGQTPVAFDPSNPPAITTNEGAVEDWTVENRTQESHEFHIHQIHFVKVAENGTPVSDGQYLDTINVPYWSGTGPYPSVTLRMDFRGVTPGDFVYHCHILAHEDAGMMAVIRVLPAGN